MPKTYKLSLVLIGFLLVLFAGMHSASAQTPDACQDGQIDQAAQQAFRQAGWNKYLISSNAMGVFGTINLKDAYCLQGLQKIFDILAALSSPFDIAKTVVAIIVDQIANQLLAILDQVCQAVMTSVQSLTNMLTSALNRICIPLPSFGLNINGVNFPSLGPPCSGVGLGTLLTMPSYTPVAVPNYQTIIPRSSQ